jgi:hypothetical protein
MSTPIIYCSIVKALESEVAMENLKKILKDNFQKGHFSIWSCQHNPQCRELTQEELDRMDKIVLEFSQGI